MRQIGKMGGAGSLMKMLPGLGKMAKQIEDAGMDDNALKQQEAIILSMTPEERTKPQTLNASRKKRIASGSGTSVQDINRLYKQLQQMQSVMKKMRKMGMGNMMGMMKKMMGSQDADMLMQSMDPNALGADMAQAQSEGPLGANPFKQGGGAGLGGGLGGGLPPGFNPNNLMGGGGLAAPARGGTKKNRKNKKKK